MLLCLNNNVFVTWAPLPLGNGGGLVRKILLRYLDKLY